MEVGDAGNRHPLESIDLERLLLEGEHERTVCGGLIAQAGFDDRNFEGHLQILGNTLAKWHEKLFVCLREPSSDHNFRGVYGHNEGGQGSSEAVNKCRDFIARCAVSVPCSSENVGGILSI